MDLVHGGPVTLFRSSPVVQCEHRLLLVLAFITTAHAELPLALERARSAAQGGDIEGARAILLADTRALDFKSWLPLERVAVYSRMGVLAFEVGDFGMRSAVCAKPPASAK